MKLLHWKVFYRNEKDQPGGTSSLFYHHHLFFYSRTVQRRGFISYAEYDFNCYLFFGSHRTYYPIQY